MTTIRCLKCGRALNVQNFDRNATCSVCQGYFKEIGQNPRNFNLSNQFNQIASSIPNIPHIIIGKQGINTSKPNYPYQTQNNPNLNTQNVNLLYSNQQIEEINREYKFKKIKDYAMYFLIAAIVSYAGYNIILSFLG